MQKRVKKLNLSRETVAELALGSIKGGLVTNELNSCVNPCGPPPNHHQTGAG